MFALWNKSHIKQVLNRTILLRHVYFWIKEIHSLDVRHQLFVEYKLWCWIEMFSHPGPILWLLAACMAKAHATCFFFLNSSYPSVFREMFHLHNANVTSMAPAFSFTCFLGWQTYCLYPSVIILACMLSLSANLILAWTKASGR